MRLFDFQCPSCGRIESDVHVRVGHAVDVWCIDCPARSLEFPFGTFLGVDVRMVRQLVAPNLRGETVART